MTKHSGQLLRKGSKISRRRVVELLRGRVDDGRPAQRPVVLVRRDRDAPGHLRDVLVHGQPAAELLLVGPVGDR